MPPIIPDVFYEAFKRKLRGGAADPVFAVGGTVNTVIPAAKFTSDGELWITGIAQEDDVFVVYTEATLNATKYIDLIDLNNALWPHCIQDHGTHCAYISSIHYSLDVGPNSKGCLKYGVITHINATNADICYFLSIPFLTGVNQEDRIVSIRGVPSQIKLDINDVGCLRHGLSNMRETVAAVNTGVTLDSPAGKNTITPIKGDVILKYEHSAGSIDFATLLFYHGQEVSI